MLKSKIFKLSCVLAIVFLNACTFRLSDKADRGLPAWPMLYLEFKNMDQRADLVLESKFWDYLKTLNFKTKIQNPNIDASLNLEYKKAIAELEKSISSQAWREIFGREVYFAFYPTDNLQANTEMASVDFLKANLNEFVLVGKMSFLAKSISQMTLLFKDHMQGLNITKEKYKGKAIYTLKDDAGDELFFAKKGSYLYLTSSKSMMKRCVAAMNKREISLARQKDHRDYKRNATASSWGAGYLAYEKLKLLAMKYFAVSVDDLSVDEAKLLKQQQIISQFNHLSGIERLSFNFLKVKEKMSKLNFSVSFDENNLSDFMSHTISKGNRDNECIEAMPAETKFLGWYANMELDLWWTSFTMLSTKEKVDSIRQKVFEYTGLNLEQDILSVLDEQIAFSAAPLDENKDKSMTFAIQLATRNSDLGMKLLDSLWAKQPILAKTIKYRDIKIKKSSVKFSDSFDPAYTVLGDYIVLNSSFAKMRKMIDASRKGRGSIADSEIFQKSETGIIDKSIAVSYMDVDFFADKIKSLLKSDSLESWYKLFASQLELKSVLRSYVVPLIDCFAFLDDLMSRFYLRDNTLNLDVFIKYN